MVRSLLTFAIILVVAVVAYNYFYGSPAERRQSEAIVRKAGDLGADAWNLLRGEREKLRDGKYDDALDRLESLYTDLREQARDLSDDGALDRLTDLGKRRRELENALGRGDELSDRAQRKLDDLTADTEALMHEMEAKSQPRAPY
ncbi:hypothetical protein [Lewinella sp. IMCC34183]|uniref:hypothetical protein n=1 Tax=Lewinella sp. IMCC34183 TaxID=2248762 RepID=UPI000E256AA6|nr:hypothetical protein [Lewinella sp. IMCC34183]